MKQRSAQNAFCEPRTVTLAALLAALCWSLAIGASLWGNLWSDRAEPSRVAQGATQSGSPAKQFAASAEVQGNLTPASRATHAVVWLTGLAVIILFRLQARRHMTARLDEQRRQRVSAEVFDQTTEGIVVTDARRRIVSVNRAFTEITGFSAEEALGRDPKDLQESGRHDTEFYRQIDQSLDDHGHWRGEIWRRRKSGEVYPEWLAISLVRDAAGQPEHYIGIFSDISQQKRDAERIRFLAYYDALTGLPNRMLLSDRAAKAVATACRSHARVALLFMDLDGFKHVNDSLGHLAGDCLLRLVGGRLGEQTRRSDTLARFGGDEFVLLLTEIEGPESVAVAARRCLDALAAPFQLEGQDVSISTSIGISIYPDDSDGVDAMVRNADTAMYQAKEAGRNQFRFFEAGMNARVTARALLGNDLRRALERGELLLHYQPQAEIATGEIVGVEALVRWEHPQRGLVAPGEFIPVAEEIGLIGRVGDWVLNEACQQVVAWQRAGLPHIPVAVNLSALQLRSPGFLDSVRRALAASGLDAHWLELELTESVLMQQVDSVMQTLQGLSELGIRIAIDDFGTGYSSLAYLRRLAIDKLKIDRSFIRDLSTDPEDALIVSTIIRMAHSLRLRVIAEGVEESEQLATLRAQGCDEIQGYHLSRPLPAAALEDFVRQRFAA